MTNVTNVITPDSLVPGYKNSTEAIEVALKAINPIVWVRTHEEARLIGQIIEVGKKLKMDTYCWSLWQGLVPSSQFNTGVRASGHFDKTWQPPIALDRIAELERKDSKKGNIVIMRDVHTVLQEPIPRQLRDLFQLLIEKRTKIIFLSPHLAHGAGGQHDGLPPTMEKQITVLDFELPNAEQVNDEIRTLIHDIIENHTQEDNNVTNPKIQQILNNLKNITSDHYNEFARALQGLTVVEIKNTVSASVHHLKTVNTKFLLDSKKQILSRSDILEYFEPNRTMDDIGGMDLMKSFFDDYKYSHTKEARDFGVEPLRGVLMVGVPGCQPRGSKVLMANGSWKNIEDIQVGDFVVSPDGSKSSMARVERLVKQSDQPIYEITGTRRGFSRKTRVAGNHLLHLAKSVDGTSYVNMTVDKYHNLGETYAERFKLVSSPSVEFSSTETNKLHPYIVGLLLGDGSITEGQQPNLTTADKNLVQELKNLGIVFGSVQKKKDNSASSYSITGDSALLVREVLGNYTAHDKFVPKNYLMGNINVRLEVLAGLIDSDGTDREFSSVSKQLADNFSYLVHSVGGVAHTSKRQTRYKKDDGSYSPWFNSYRVSFSFGENIPSSRLERKQLVLRDMEWKNPRHYSFSTNFIGTEDVFGFELDGLTQLYVTDDWIVTHNCGKSQMCKAVSTAWKLPLIRLDVGKVMTGLVGGSEGKMRSAISQVEAIAPCILWIDEVEKALSGTKSSNFSDGGTMARVFGTLLTSMEEGLKGVTILATANDIEALPPEFIRRFSEVFFVDLPGPSERKDIFTIHIRKKGANPEEFNLDTLVEKSEHYTGHEIEKAVARAMAFAFKDSNRKLTTSHVQSALEETKPISHIMGEKINKMRTEARSKYRYASTWARKQGERIKIKKEKMEMKDVKLPEMDKKNKVVPQISDSPVIDIDD